MRNKYDLRLAIDGGDATFTALTWKGECALRGCFSDACIKNSQVTTPAKYAGDVGYACTQAGAKFEPTGDMIRVFIAAQED